MMRRGSQQQWMDLVNDVSEKGYMAETLPKVARGSWKTA